MQPNLPLWFQRLPPERLRRLELAEAAANEARLDTHAEQALNLVAVFAHRMSFDQAVERYIDMMSLDHEEGQLVRQRALVILAESDGAEALSRDPRRQRLNWRYATPAGAFRYVKRQLRRNAEEDLWMEMSAARAEEALIRTHVKHALNFVHILEDQFPPTRAISLYIEELDIPSSRSRAIYQRALARVAAAELPRVVINPDGSRKG